MENSGEKRTLLSRLDNIWYHYKTPIIIGFFVLVMLCVAFAQFFSKKDPDVFIYYVGQSSATAKDIEQFQADMCEIMPRDYNGDGVKTVDYKEDIFVMYSVNDGIENSSYVYNSTDQMNIVKRFNMELGMGECVVYIMEPNLFKANTDYIMPLEDVLGYVPDECEEGKGFKLSSLGAYRKTALGKFPEDYIICVRAQRQGDDEDVYNANADFFKSLVEYK